MAKKKYIPNVVNKVIESGNHWETDPFEEGVHNGEDLINRTPTTKAKADWIVAIEKGKVVYTGYGSKSGYYVRVKHANGYYSEYKHLKKGTIVVQTNQMVAKGQRLGYMGDSGNAQGVHLHLAIRPNLKTYIDPYPYLIGEKNFDNTWPTGDYITLKSKYIRLTPKVATNNYVKVKECRPDIKPLLTSNKPNDKARFKVGVKVTITGFSTDNKGNLWGKLNNTWICVWDSTGNQVKKV
jgi:murein DD-endopeptidase MepM/ murein hydrolase activator NlpD